MEVFYKLKGFVNRTPFLNKCNRIRKLIIDVVPYYLVREEIASDTQLNFTPKLNDTFLALKRLARSDVISLAEHPEVPETKDTLVERIRDGGLCFGLLFKDQIVAYIWGNLSECATDLVSFKLQENEAYLMDTRTFISYRGKSLAPYLRYEFYKYLCQQYERDRFYSITLYFNKSAFRFKQKLKARPLHLSLWVCFLKTIKFNIILQKYI